MLFAWCSGFVAIPNITKLIKITLGTFNVKILIVILWISAFVSLLKLYGAKLHHAKEQSTVKTRYINNKLSIGPTIEK